MNLQAIYRVAFASLLFWAPAIVVTGLASAAGIAMAARFCGVKGNARKAFAIGWASGAIAVLVVWVAVPRAWLPLLFYGSEYETVGSGLWERARFLAEQYTPAIFGGALAALCGAILATIFASTPDGTVGSTPRKYRFALKSLLASHVTLGVLLGGWLAYHRETIFSQGAELARQSDLDVANVDWKHSGFRVQKLDENGFVVMVSFDPSGPLITNASWDLLAEQPRLEFLDLREANVGDSELARVANLQSLKQLLLNSPKVTDKGIEAIVKLSRLEMLHVESSQLTSRVSAHLARLKTLKYLDLPGVPINDQSLADLASLKNLNRVTLDGAVITVKGAAQFKGLDQLSCIILKGATISDDALAHLKDLARLDALYLAGSSITDEGAKHLADMPQLVRLDLGGTKITDEALVHVGRLKNLQSLTLSRTSITDSGLRHIKDLPNLEYLEIVGTGVTAEGKRQMRIVYPGAVP